MVKLFPIGCIGLTFPKGVTGNGLIFFVLEDPSYPIPEYLQELATLRGLACTRRCLGGGRGDGRVGVAVGTWEGGGG